MDASDALTELLDLSTQVVEAVITGPDGAIEASRTAGEERARALSVTGSELLATAARARSGSTPRRVQIDLDRGSVVVASDGERAIIVTTVPEPTSVLVAHDLRVTLGRLEASRR